MVSLGGFSALLSRWTDTHDGDATRRPSHKSTGYGSGYRGRYTVSLPQNEKQKENDDQLTTEAAEEERKESEQIRLAARGGEQVSTSEAN